jgi:RimJ/RimL family protein N-acetyltransferase
MVTSKYLHTRLEKKEQVFDFFKNEKKDMKTFMKFVERGYEGLVWHTETEWISYAWMSTPESQAPPHLPHWVQSLHVYWLFNFYTKDSYRKQGLHRASVILLSKLAREKDFKARIYADVQPGNIPPIKSLLSVGFVPAGVIYTMTLRIPKFWYVFYGNWVKEEPHPAVS